MDEVIGLKEGLSNVKNVSDYSSFNVDIDNNYIGTTPAASNRKQTIKKGIDIVAILDTSGSMNAEDFKPKNRMEVAKETLNQFIKKRTNDRVGLVIFGNDAITKSPMTIDHKIISNQIGQINVGDAGDGLQSGLLLRQALIV